MTLLTFTGLLAFIFVVWFTHVQYSAHPGAGQSPQSSIIEAWVNIAIGLAINWPINWLLLPMVGAHFSGWDNFVLGLDYTCVSMLRQFVIRRWFNDKIHRAALALDKGN